MLNLRCIHVLGQLAGYVGEESLVEGAGVEEKKSSQSGKLERYSDLFMEILLLGTDTDAESIF